MVGWYLVPAHVHTRAVRPKFLVPAVAQAGVASARPHDRYTICGLTDRHRHSPATRQRKDSIPELLDLVQALTL